MNTSVIFCIVLLSEILIVLGHFQGISSIIRRKRDAVGNLEIVTNNVQPIHAEVKPSASDTTSENAGHSASDQGDDLTEKVTPPETVLLGHPTSGRKSSPRTNKFDIIRNVSRVFTLLMLILSAVVEFFPLIQQLYYMYYF